MAGRPADHLTPVGEALADRLGARLHGRRTVLGRTLADVAQEAELSVSYLSAVEKGQSMPSLPVLGRLVHALRLTLHELLREEDRLLLRTGELPRDEGVHELSHADLRLTVVTVTAAPGQSGPAPVPAFGSAVFVFVEHGALLVEVDGAPYALGQGDALDAVDVGDVRWQVLGEVPATSLWGSSPDRKKSAP